MVGVSPKAAPTPTKPPSVFEQKEWRNRPIECSTDGEGVLATLPNEGGNGPSRH